MSASLENPVYTTYVVSGSKKYNISPAVEGLSFSDQEKQLSKSVNIDVMNIETGGTWLSSILAVRSRVYIYANDGERNEEVWRGFIWKRTYKSSVNECTVSLKCYDNLIYFQESEESEFFSSGRSTKDVMSSICNKWGVKLEYNYESITHAKLALRGTLSDIFTDDILDLVKDRTGKKYVILSDKDVMQVKAVGQNTKVYQIKAGENTISTGSECTMDGMVTKVVILGKANDDDRRPVEATVSGDTSAYGTIQKLVNRDENTSLADAKEEAQSTIKKDGNPKWEYSIKAPDIPWIRKGDRVNVEAGDMGGSYIVLGIDREINNKEKTMDLTLEMDNG